MRCYDYNRLRNSHMKNIVLIVCWKIVPLVYVFIQTCLALTILQLGLSQNLHFTAMGLATLAYFTVCFKDPGYVDKKQCAIKKQSQVSNGEGSSPRQLIKSNSPRSLNTEYESKKRDHIQVILQLGLQSNIQSQRQNKQQALPSALQGYDRVHKLEDCILQKEDVKGCSIHPELQKVKRWCRECDTPQKLRVRHCVECNRCVMTFDHHCLWVANCIGEKNRLVLLVYLMLQIGQVGALAVNLGLSMGEFSRKESLFLEIVLIVVGVGICGILFFQLYLVGCNLTTWQHVGWNRIEYLMIFQKQRLISLFNEGVRANIAMFVRTSCRKQPTNWQQHISAQFADCFRNPKSILQMIDNPH